jgi:hypothetical protein
MPAENKDAIMLSLGALLAAFATVTGYFFGSSKGSADKNDALLKTESAKSSAEGGEKSAS